MRQQHFILFYFWFCFLIFIVFFPLPFSALIPPTSSNHHTVHVHELFSIVAQSLCPLASPNHQLSSCSPPGSLSPFSSLVQLVHQIPHMSEIIWYLSFSDQLISLSMIFSRFIHTVTKGKIFFFLWLSSTPLQKCPIVVLSTHLLMDPWTVSLSW